MAIGHEIQVGLQREADTPRAGPVAALPTQARELAPRLRGSTADGCPRCGGLHTGITVTTQPDGSVVASVELRGTICGPAVPALLAAIDELHELGVTAVNIDLSGTTPCDR